MNHVHLLHFSFSKHEQFISSLIVSILWNFCYLIQLRPLSEGQPTGYAGLFGLVTKENEERCRDKRELMLERGLEEMAKRSLDEVVQQASQQEMQERSLENLFRKVRDAVDQF